MRSIEEESSAVQLLCSNPLQRTATLAVLTSKGCCATGGLTRVTVFR